MRRSKAHLRQGDSPSGRNSPDGESEESEDTGRGREVLSKRFDVPENMMLQVLPVASGDPALLARIRSGDLTPGRASAHTIGRVEERQVRTGPARTGQAMFVSA
jgi:hypothetical protein